MPGSTDASKALPGNVMRRLSNTFIMKKSFELTRGQMKRITGGGGPDEPSITPPPTPDWEYGHCYIDGEIIFELRCTDAEICKQYYGDAAKCYK